MDYASYYACRNFSLKFIAGVFIISHSRSIKQRNSLVHIPFLDRPRAHIIPSFAIGVFRLVFWVSEDGTPAAESPADGHVSSRVL